MPEFWTARKESPGLLWLKGGAYRPHPQGGESVKGERNSKLAADAKIGNKKPRHLRAIDRGYAAKIVRDAYNKPSGALIDGW